MYCLNIQFRIELKKARDGRYIAYDNGTVLDTKTGLMWASKDNGRDINWANAKSYCENYRGGGYSDWRMPLLNELEGLYDATITQNNVGIRKPNLFDSFGSGVFWASDTRGSEAIIYSFGDSFRTWNPQSTATRRALPVRSGKEIKQSPQAVQTGDGREPLSPPRDRVILTTFNTAGVQSGTPRSMTFTFKEANRITYIKTYHYVNNGKPAGTIALRHEDGTMYGPWQAEGTDLGGNVPNAFWVVRPNIEIKPGRYSIFDSDPSTWSYNSQSKGWGMIEIKGIKLASQNAQQNPQARQEESVVAASAGEKARDSRFIAYHNGTVRDTKTNLMWVAKDNGTHINWANAKSYCENYRGGGYADWRMPTIDELAGLFDATITDKKNYHKTYLIELTGCCPWASDTMRDSWAADFNFWYAEPARDWTVKSHDFDYRALPVRSGK